jgi:hypothetical protein
VVGVVHPAAGVGVLEPGPADVGVLVDHDEGDADLLQSVGREQPRHAGADDRDLERGVGRDGGLGPLRGAQVVAGDRQLLLEQPEVLGRHRQAGGELHHRQEVVIGGDRRLGAARVAITDQLLQGELARLRLLRLGHPALWLGDEQRVDAEVVAQQRAVAAQVRQRGEQRWDHRVVECRPDLVVGRDDRFSRWSHGPVPPDARPNAPCLRP